ncbi:MAG: HlyD family efflux transporter periplasmic adaptor subunit [Polyangiaceae bacterium]|nr:HlyD family efflux transporter periplasmic adaptor subunit [Polyangiaceae bacterium]
MRVPALGASASSPALGALGVTTPFSRTLRSLEQAPLRPQLLAVGAMSVLAVLAGVWLARGSITVYAVSQGARFEVDEAAHPVEPPVAGVVASSALALGRPVRAGDELLVLDSTIERARLTREEARVANAERALEALGSELAAETDALALEREAASAAVGVARARSAVAALLARSASQQDESIQKLRESQLATGLEAASSSNEAKRQKAEAMAVQLSAREVRSLHNTSLGDRFVRIARLVRNRTEMQGELDSSRAAADALRHEIALRTVRAPVDGTIAELNPVTPGAFVAAGQKLATVVPPGALRLVASFAPADAVGRVGPGQPATVRLDGFPWAQYGTVGASVGHVANEPRDNAIRVELRVSRPNPGIPMGHGLTASVEVEVERVSPAVLLLRSIGQMVTRPVATPPAAAGPPASAPR